MSAHRSIATFAGAWLLVACTTSSNPQPSVDASSDGPAGEDSGEPNDGATPDATLSDATIDAPADAEDAADTGDDAPADAAIDAPSEASVDASDASIDAPIDAPADATPVADAAVTGWVYVRIDDCTGNDQGIGYSTGTDVPVAADCNAADNGVAAVCWDQTTYTNTLLPGGSPGCTYKTVPQASCTGGTRPGYLYVCNAP